MSDPSKPVADSPRRHYTLRVVLSVVIVLMGISGFFALAGLKKPPAEVDSGERALKVEVMTVKADAIPVTITGYGEVRTVKAVNLSAEVSGRVAAVHPRLRVGELIDADELLFRIDDRTYAAAAAQSRAEVDQLTSVVTRLEKQAVIDAQRLKTLERSRVLARADVEQGQYVTPGQPLIVMADDRLLEIQVPLDSKDVRQWLRFEAEADAGRRAWFGQPEPVVCRIRWTEDKGGHVWNGRLHRIVVYDQKTRTITVAVRIGAADAVSDNGALPLVQGMFCAVDIPGRTLPHAFKVPRAAVSFKNTVFVAADRRLKTVDVEVARVDGDFAYITDGLTEGDTVIVTRLVDPLENSLLEVMSGS